MTQLVKYRGIIGKPIRRGAIVYFVTPHNSVIKMGDYWFDRDSSPLNLEDRKKAIDLIRQAKLDNVKPFSIDIDLLHSNR